MALPTAPPPGTTPAAFQTWSQNVSDTADDHETRITGKVSKTGGDTITASAAAVTPLAVKGAASQTANLLEVKDSAGTVLSIITAEGNVHVRSSGLGANLGVAAGGAAQKALVIRGAASQTANLLEVQDSAGSALLAVGASGTLNLVAASTSTAATAGAATLPANPVGFLQLIIAGTTRKIPFYAV